MEAPDLEVGPPSLRGWAAKVVEAIRTNYNECVTRHFHGKSGSSDPAGGEGEEGGHGAQGGSDIQFSFLISDASDEDGPKVLILDGLVGTPSDQELPTGMGVLSVVDGDAIWVGITYDTDTLEITSRFLDHGATVPDDAFGEAYFKIGDVAVDSGGDTPVITPTNSICGDILFTFDFGGRNGRPALKLGQYNDWVEVPVS